MVRRRHILINYFLVETNILNKEKFVNKICHKITGIYKETC